MATKKSALYNLTTHPEKKEKMRHLLPYLLSLAICFIPQKASYSTTTTSNTEKTFVIFYADLTSQHMSCILPSSTNIQTACKYFLNLNNHVTYAKFYIMDAQGRKKSIAWNQETTTEQFKFNIKQDLKGLNRSFEEHMQAEAQKNRKKKADQMTRDELTFIFRYFKNLNKITPLKEPTLKNYFNSIRTLLNEEIINAPSFDNYVDQLSKNLQEALNNSPNEKVRLFNRLTNDQKSQQEQIKEMLTHIIGGAAANNNIPVKKKQLTEFKKKYISSNQRFPNPFLFNKAQLNSFFQEAPKISQNTQELARTGNKDLFYTYTYLKTKEEEQGAMMDEEMNTSHSLLELDIQLDTSREETPIPIPEIIPPINTSSIESSTKEKTESTTPSLLQGIGLGIVGSIAVVKGMSTKKKRKQSKKA